MPTILSGLHEISTARTVSFEVLVSPPSPGSASRAVDCCSSGLHEISTARTVSFEVLVSPPSPGSASRAVDCCSRLSKIPSRTRAQVEAFFYRSSATAFSSRGMWCRSKTLKSFSSFQTWSRYATNCGSLQQHSPLTCLMMS
jgi:hypothetical protein